MTHEHDTAVTDEMKAKTPPPLTYPAEFDVMPALEELRDRVPTPNDSHLLGSAMLEIHELRTRLSTLEAALSSRASAEPVRVEIKPLEWDVFGRAHSVVGTYDVSCIADGGVFGLILPGDENNTFPYFVQGSEADCRAAAQAHFDRSIRSALVSLPSVSELEGEIRRAGLKARDDLLERMFDGGTVDNDLADRMTSIVDACVSAALEQASSIHPDQPKEKTNG